MTSYIAKDEVEEVGVVLVKSQSQIRCNNSVFVKPESQIRCNHSVRVC